MAPKRQDNGIEKSCSICKLTKPVSEFYNNPNGYGFRGKCKSCYTEDSVRRAREKGYKSSPEVRRRATKRYEAKTKEKRAEYQREYRRRNKNELNAKRRIKYAEDSSVVKRYVHKRRAVKASSSGSYTDEEWDLILEAYGCKCLKCNKAEVTVDHVVPLSRGGSNYASNLQPLCKSCNSLKGTEIADYRPFIIFASDVCSII